MSDRMAEYDRQEVARLKRALYNGCSLSESDAQRVSDYVDSLEDLLDTSDDFDVHGEEGWRGRVFGPVSEEC